MIITYTIKDEHLAEFVRVLGGEPGLTVEDNQNVLQAWLNERLDPTYKEVINNILEADPDIIRAVADLSALRGQKELEIKAENK